MVDELTGVDRSARPGYGDSHGKIGVHGGAVLRCFRPVADAQAAVVAGRSGATRVYVRIAPYQNEPVPVAALKEADRRVEPGFTKSGEIVVQDPLRAPAGPDTGGDTGGDRRYADGSRRGASDKQQPCLVVVVLRLLPEADRLVRVVGCAVQVVRPLAVVEAVSGHAGTKDHSRDGDAHRSDADHQGLPEGPLPFDRGGVIPDHSGGVPVFRFRTVRPIVDDGESRRVEVKEDLVGQRLLLHVSEYGLVVRGEHHDAVKGVPVATTHPVEDAPLFGGKRVIRYGLVKFVGCGQERSRQRSIELYDRIGKVPVIEDAPVLPLQLYPVPVPSRR